MSRNVNDIIKKLSPAQRKKVETRAAQLIAEEMTLRQLRQACKLTQQKVAKSLHIGQEGVSKLEKRSDLLISTLRDYLKAMGGQLSLVVEFPDRKPVIFVWYCRICGTSTAVNAPARSEQDFHGSLFVDQVDTDSKLREG